MLKKFLIFGLGRSGSSLLVNLLNAHPAIHCDSEIFHRKHRWQRIKHRYPFLILTFRQFLARRRASTSVYGFKLFKSQVDDPDQMIHRFHADGWRIVYLQRLSIFDQAISDIVAHRTHRFHGKIGQAEQETHPFPIEPELFLQQMRIKTKSTQQCKDIMASVPHLHIIYERDLATPDCWQKTLESAYTYIGIAPSATPAYTSVTKPWVRPYSELITNYTELVELARQEGRDA